MQEAKNAVQTLTTLAEIAFQCVYEDCRRKSLLKESPEGFHLDRRGACQICKNITFGEQSWYDKYGLKCMTCQRAINKRAIPPSVATTTEHWYSAREFEYAFNIKKPQLRKLVKTGILKDRNIEGENGKVHLQLFLIKENKGFLPPKRLLKGGAGKEVIDGKMWTVFYSWHQIVDPVEHLRKYGVASYLGFNDNSR